MSVAEERKSEKEKKDEEIEFRKQVFLQLKHDVINRVDRYLE